MCDFVMEQPGTPPVRFPQTLQQNHKALRVLIIDDEELFCWTLTTILEDLDYAVLSAHAAVQALEYLRNDQQIALALLDIRLSDVGEAESLSLLEKLRTLRPRTPVIVMSAFGTQELKRKADRFGARAFLDKPFRVERLLRLMREIMEEPIAPN